MVRKDILKTIGIIAASFSQLGEYTSVNAGHGTIEYIGELNLGHTNRSLNPMEQPVADTDFLKDEYKISMSSTQPTYKERSHPIV